MFLFDEVASGDIVGLAQVVGFLVSRSPFIGLSH